MTTKNPHAVALGRLGGAARSPAKTAAVRRNAKLGGGRPTCYRLTLGLDDDLLERREGDIWVTLSPPYDAAARAYLRRQIG